MNNQDKLPKSASILRGVPINKFSIFFIEVYCKLKYRAGSRLPCVGGAQPGEGSRGPPRPFVGPGQSPGRGFRRRSPRRKTVFSVLEWLGWLSIALFCKKNHRFAIVRNIKKIYDHMFYLKSVARKSAPP